MFAGEGTRRPGRRRSPSGPATEGAAACARHHHRARADLSSQARSRERGGGRIINIASTTAFKGTAYLLHYTSSKGAILAMTKALARELGGDGILVNAVAPGFTVSEGVEQHAERVSTMRSNAPGSRILRREMVPGDVVGAVRFLAGPSSGFMTGQTIVVDGGAYLH
jgi:NAD(P)-dependent dehydrogenase (short-subunit alcohol dehydrogenase family)